MGEIMGYAILRTQKIKSLSGVNAVLRHNRRDVKCVSVVNEKIKNPKLIFEKMSEDTKKPYTKFFKAIEVVLTFSKGSLSDNEIKPWIRKSVEFLAEKFGGWQNIYDVQYHVDEMQEHLHALLIPIDSQGNLNCRHYLGSAAKMRELQDAYAEAMKEFGLERGKPKRLTKEEHKTSVQWHKEQSENDCKLKTYQDMFGQPLDWSFDKRMEFYDSYNAFLKDSNDFISEHNLTIEK